MNLFNPTRQELRQWHLWLLDRPQKVREIAIRFPPWKVLQLRSSGHLVTMRSIQENEDGTVTVTVHVSERLNSPLLFEREVFGVFPHDLEDAATDSEAAAT